MTVIPPIRLVLTGAALVAGLVATSFANPSLKGHPRSPVSERVALARVILKAPHVDLLDYHVSGQKDEATARHNLWQTALGRPVKRSYYGRAPGGTTRLSRKVLRAIHQLAREGYSFRITELAGGSHCSGSRHYDGVAFDIDMLNGRKIAAGHPSSRRFLQRCRELGATEVFGPGTRGHGSHLHIAWPRPDESVAGRR